MRVDVVCAHIYKQRQCGGRVGGIHQNIYHKNYKKKPPVRSELCSVSVGAMQEDMAGR